jgi:CBS domain-containing protein
MQTLIRDLLAAKGHDVWAVSPTTSVLDTLLLLAEKDVGALMVMDGDKLVGIISERDFARSIAKLKKCLIYTEVKDYMTEDVITISDEKTVQDCMKLMTKEHIRHLPVVVDNRVIGMISIGDVVRALLAEAESRITNLEDFIEGRGYGQ